MRFATSLLLCLLTSPFGCGGESSFDDADGDADADSDTDTDTDADSDADTDTGLSNDVCERWTSEWPTRASFVWRQGAGQCDLGEVSDDARADAVRRTNLYRWLSGLDPIVNNETFSSKAQECAVLMRAIGGITHTPSPGSACYTANAAEAAGSSNLAGGAGSMADAVDQYIGDEGVDSLGHRRWILYPPYAEGGFGIASVFSCQWVFGSGEQGNPEFVAYPAPGDYPIAAIRGAWSLGADGVSFASASVTVTRLSDGTPLTISQVWAPPKGYGQNTLAWRVTDAISEDEYEISVTGATGARSEFTYTSNLRVCR